MTKYREILRLKNLGFSERNIAQSCGVSRNTVAKVLKKATEMNISWRLDFDMTDSALEELMFPKDKSATNKRIPDFDYIRKELLRNGVNKKLLWVEYCEECRMNGEDPLMYSQFCYYIQKDEEKRRATMHIPRKPGEQIEVDWAGDPAHIIDPDTGEITDAWIFVGVLTYSQYAFVKAYMDEKTNNWIKAHVQMFEFFGGVTPMLISDNCTTAVNHAKSDWYERIQAENERKQATSTALDNIESMIAEANTAIDTVNSLESAITEAEKSRVEAEQIRENNSATAVTNAETATKRANDIAQICENIVAGTGFITDAEKGSAGGVATLDENGFIPSSQIPGSYDNVDEGIAVGISKNESTGTNTATGFIVNGDSEECIPRSETIYIDTTTNIQYRWSGSIFVSTGSSLALGDTQNTAGRGDWTKSAYEHSLESGNPHGTNLNDLGIPNVEIKSSETIRNEITDQNVVNALGYVPAKKTDIDEINTKIASLGLFTVGSSAPSNTNQLWIDTSNSGLMKYFDGSDWKPIASAWV